METMKGVMDKKDKNSDGKVYKKEKSNVLREEDVVLFKQGER